MVSKPSSADSSSTKCPSRWGRQDIDPPPTKPDDPVGEGKQRIVAPPADVLSGQMRRAALPHDDRPDSYRLTCEALHAPVLWLAVSPVPRGTLTLFMCHLVSLRPAGHSQHRPSSPYRHGASNHLITHSLVRRTGLASQCFSGAPGRSYTIDRVRRRMKERGLFSDVFFLASNAGFGTRCTSPESPPA